MKETEGSAKKIERVDVFAEFASQGTRGHNFANLLHCVANKNSTVWLISDLFRTNASFMFIKESFRSLQWRNPFFGLLLKLILARAHFSLLVNVSTF